MNTQRIPCDARAPGEPLRHTWSVCVGAGRANEGLRADWQRQLRRAVAECGFRYIRFHGLFHDDMMVYREDKHGRGIYNWQYIDALFDALLEIGIRPFVELGFCPRALATKVETTMWWKAHGSPPKDYRQWAELISRLTAHCLARYGREEVRRWYFEVWNEPNLGPFFCGTKTQYFELYRTTVQAIKKLDGQLRVGGPATANLVPDTRFDGERENTKIGAASIRKNPDSLFWRPVWVEQFLLWCARERLPVDFVSTHPYPTDFALVGHGKYKGVSRRKEAIVNDLRLLRQIIDASPYPQAEIHCTEWNSSPSPRDPMHDFPPAATYVVFANVAGGQATDSLSYWTFTDILEEGGAGDTCWHGGFGLLNFQGLPKPTYHAYRFLHQLGQERLAQGDGYLITRHHDERVTAILYHYPKEVPKSPPLCSSPAMARAVLKKGRPKKVRLELRALPPHARFSIETLDANSGWSRAAWEKMGAAEPPTREEVALLQQASAPAVRFCQADAKGTLALEVELSPWAVILVNQLA